VKARRITTELEVGKYTFRDIMGERIGIAESRATILRRQKLIARAKIETVFKPGKPGVEVPAISRILLEKPAKPMKLWALAKAKVFPEVRGVYPGVSRAIIFEKGKPIAAAYARSITKMRADISRTIGVSITGPKITPGIYGAIFQRIKPSVPSVFFKPPKIVTKVKPAPPIVGVTAEAITKGVVKVITKPPKVVPKVGVLTGAITAFAGRAEPFVAMKYKPLEEEEVYISPEAAKIVGIPTLVARERVLAMQRYGLTQKTMEGTLQELGIGETLKPTLKPIQRPITIQRTVPIQVPKLIPITTPKVTLKFPPRLTLRPPITKVVPVVPITKPPIKVGVPLIRRIKKKKPPIRKKKPPIKRGFHVFVKRRKLKVRKGKYRARGYMRVSRKPLPKAQALGLGASIVDKYVNRSFKIRPAKKPPVSKPRLGALWSRKKHKFRYKIRKRTKIPGVIVEKSKFAIDSPEERAGIPFKALRMRRAGLIVPRRKRRRRMI